MEAGEVIIAAAIVSYTLWAVWYIATDIRKSREEESDLIRRSVTIKMYGRHRHP